MDDDDDDEKDVHVYPTPEQQKATTRHMVDWCVGSRWPSPLFFFSTPAFMESSRNKSTAEEGYISRGAGGIVCCAPVFLYLLI